MSRHDLWSVQPMESIMSDQPPKKPISTMLLELKRSQRLAAKMGMILAASLIGMAVINLEEEQARRDEITHVNDNPNGDRKA